MFHSVQATNVSAYIFLIHSWNSNYAQIDLESQTQYKMICDVEEEKINFASAHSRLTAWGPDKR